MTIEEEKKKEKKKWGKRSAFDDTPPEEGEYFKLLLTDDNPTILTGDNPKSPVERFKTDSEKIVKALECAQDLRKFEIELFWKRATYFWVFIPVIFLTYGALIRLFMTENGIKDEFQSFLFIAIITLNVLGLIISYIWYLAMKGSKRWQKTWEAHVDMLEFHVIGNLYKTILAEKDNITFSVTKLSKAASKCCIWAWGTLLLVSFAMFWFELLYYIAIIFTIGLDGFSLFCLIGVGVGVGLGYLVYKSIKGVCNKIESTCRSGINS